MVNLDDYDFSTLLSSAEVAPLIVRRTKEHYLNFKGMDVSITPEDRVFIMRSRGANIKYQEVPIADWREFELTSYMRDGRAEFINSDYAFLRAKTGEYKRCHLPSQTFETITAQEYAAEKGLSNEICKTTTRSILTDEEVEKLEKNN